MTDSINANVVVSMPSQLFTMARSFKAVANGKIYIGKIDTDPVNPENRIQVYVENEDGSHVPVSQPIIINAAGYPVYNGQIAKFVTVQGHSMAVYDAYGAQQFYFPNVLKYDPDQFKPELQGANGASLIGTNHRGTLKADLDAIDRRPDGYRGSIQDAFATGKNVEIGENIDVSDKITVANGFVLEGAGGTITSSVQSDLISFDHQVGANGDKSRLSNLKVEGQITPSGSPGYAIFARESKDSYINGLHSTQATGAVSLNSTDGAIVRDVWARNTVYHPSLVAGGYGFLTAGTKNTIMDGLQFNAEAGYIGRHMLYISTQSRTDGSYDGSKNTIATNMVGEWTDKDDRNMHVMNIRKSDHSIISQFIGDGSNSGISVFTENGNVLNSLISNGILRVESYGAGIIARAFGCGEINGYRMIGSRISNLLIENQPKNGDASLGGLCYGLTFTVSNCMFDGIITKCHSAGRPFVIGASTDVSICNILDFVDASDTGGKQVLFTFDGAASRIKFSNIKSPRTFFNISNLQANATDISVDWARKARVNVNSGSAAVSGDSWGLISNVATTASSIVVAFHNHVTQEAVGGALVRAASGNQFVVTETDSKKLTISVYNVNGTGVVPNTGTYSFDIVLYE